MTFAGKATRKLARLGPYSLLPSSLLPPLLTLCVCVGVGERERGCSILLSPCWISIYSLWSNLSSSSLVIPCNKSVPLSTSSSLSCKALPVPSLPERYSVDHASRVSTWASTPGCTNCARRDPHPACINQGPIWGPSPHHPPRGVAPNSGPSKSRGE